MAVIRPLAVNIRSNLQGPVAVDRFFRPHFCATIWSDILRAHWKDSTRSKRLADIGQFYDFVQVNLGSSLDCLIIEGRLTELEGALTSYLTELRGASALPRMDVERTWDVALRFVLDMLDHVGASSPRADFQARILRLQRLYSQLSPRGPRPPNAIRALPAVVVEDLYEVFNPLSSRNPYKTERLRWRNFAVFLLLLHLGLRRGELLSLGLDSFKAEFDLTVEGTRHWLAIEERRPGEDPRALRPSLKTSSSWRTIPLSNQLADLVSAYIAGHRGRPAHPFLLNSQKGAPLSAPMLTEIMATASAALSNVAKEALNNRSVTRVSAHDLRHTAVVARLQRYRDEGFSIEESMEKSRPFFGWSRTSRMPLLYGRAYFEPTSAELWHETFDDHVASLRRLGELVQ